MSLCLIVFDGDPDDEDVEEVAAVAVGSYSDYGRFLEAIIVHCEHEDQGSRFPHITLHSDCDGEWPVAQFDELEFNLKQIGLEFRAIPAIPLSGWQANMAEVNGISPTNLAECFFDVDGEPLIERLLGLINKARRVGSPILFQ